MALTARAARAAVFFDKDGTLIDDVPYNVAPTRIHLAPGAQAAVQALHAVGFVIAVISNQPGVAHGYFSEAALDTVTATLRALLAPTPIAGFYYCPHHPHGAVARYARGCDCRKPAPALLQRAARELNIDLTRSWFVGDILNDVEAGRRAGCRTILLDNGNETEWQLTALRTPELFARDLRAAYAYIVAASAWQRAAVS